MSGRDQISLLALAGILLGCVLGTFLGVSLIIFLIEGVRFLVGCIVGRDVGLGVIVNGFLIFDGFLVLVILVVSSVIDFRSTRARRLRSRAPVHGHMAPPLPIAPRSLRWLGGLLPGNEGMAWLAEVGSCLAEAADKGERRRYVRSYRRNVPQLIWTSWSEHLSTSRSRELL